MIALDTETTYPYVLEAYRGQPIEPTFYLAIPSARQSVVVRRLIKTTLADGFPTEDAEINTLCEALGKHIKRWENISVPYSPLAIADVCTPNEIYELIGLVAHGNIEVSDQKN